MINFIYISLLLFIIIFMLWLLMLNGKNCPLKLKRFFKVVFLLLLLRYIAMLVGMLVDEQFLIYLLRPLILINYCAVPLLVFGVLYIFLRSEDQSFNYNFIFMIILITMYVVLVIIYKVNIGIHNTFGFVVTFKESLTPNLIYLIIMASLSVVSLLSIDKPYCNRFGMRSLTACTMISIVEFIVFLGGIKLLPYPLLGEILFLFLAYKAIKTFVK